jgi:hypothetical protein
MLKTELEDIKAIESVVSLYTCYINTTSGQVKSVTVEKKVSFDPANKCTEVLEEKWEDGEQKQVASSEKSGESTHKLRVDVVPRREGNLLLAHILVENTSEDFIFWQSTPSAIRVEIIKQVESAPVEPELAPAPLLFELLARYSTFNKFFLLATSHIKEEDFVVYELGPKTPNRILSRVCIQGAYFNLNERSWGQLSYDAVIAFDAPDFRGTLISESEISPPVKGK